MRQQAFKVLNLGGHSKAIGLPQHYANWQHLLLDIQPHPDVDFVLDSRQLERLGPHQFDAVYTAHHLEHFYAHELPDIFTHIKHVLKPAGFVEIITPDLETVMEQAIKHKLMLNDELYHSPLGPITVHDVLYGYGPELASSQNDFYAHKTGFDCQRMQQYLENAGYVHIHVHRIPQRFELRALGFLRPPSPRQQRLLGLLSNAP